MHSQTKGRLFHHQEGQDQKDEEENRNLLHTVGTHLGAAPTRLTPLSSVGPAHS